MVNIWPSDGPLEVKFAAGGILVPFRGKHLVQIHFGVKRSSRPNIAKSKCFTCCNVCIVAIHVYETTVISIDLGSKSKQKGSLVCTCTLIWVSIICFTDILLAHEEMQRVSALCSNKGNISQFYSVIVLTWKKTFAFIDINCELTLNLHHYLVLYQNLGHGDTLLDGQQLNQFMSVTFIHF